MYLAVYYNNSVQLPYSSTMDSVRLAIAVNKVILW